MIQVGNRAEYVIWSLEGEERSWWRCGRKATSEIPSSTVIPIPTPWWGVGMVCVCVCVCVLGVLWWKLRMSRNDMDTEAEL